jgi:exosome complex RNA-binding protein Rrp4
LVFYPCQLIKRQRQHFVNLTPEIRIIIGCNGLLWVSFIQSVQPKENSEDDDTGKYEQLTVVPASVKSKISMMAAQMNSYADLRIELNSKALMDLSEVIKLDEDAEV